MTLNYENVQRKNKKNPVSWKEGRIRVELVFKISRKQDSAPKREV